MGRAAIYVRLSKDAEGTTSPTRQREACRRIVDANGWTHDPTVDLYEDVDFSAFTGAPRPAYDRLMGSLDRYDTIVFWRLDRLVRRITSWGRILEAAEQHQVALVSATEALDTSTPVGRMVASMLASVAEMEGHTIAARVRSAQQHLAHVGRWRGGVVPFGWDKAPVEGGGWQLVLDPDTAPLLRDIIDRIIGGDSSRAIAEDLNDRGVPTVKGGRWSSTTVLGMVRHPRLLGQRIHDGRPIVDDDGVPLTVDPPLIDRDTWDRLQAALSGRDRRRGLSTHATLLSGLVRCGRCGGPMSGWTADDPRASYLCSRYTNGGRDVCAGPNSISRQHLDRLMVDTVTRRLSGQHLAAARRLAVTRRRQSPDPATARAGQIRDALDRLETDRLELGIYDDEQGRVRYATAHRRLTDELAALEQARRPMSGGPDLLDVLGDDEDPSEVMASHRRARALLRAVVDHVTVGPATTGRKWDPGRVDVAWLF